MDKQITQLDLSKSTGLSIVLQKRKLTQSLAPLFKPLPRTIIPTQFLIYIATKYVLYKNLHAIKLLRTVSSTFSQFFQSGIICIPISCLNLGASKTLLSNCFQYFFTILSIRYCMHPNFLFEFQVLPKLSSQTLQALLTSDELWVPSEEKR